MDINNYINYINRHPSAWIGHGVFATELVRIFKPNIIVDLGVDYGVIKHCSDDEFGTLGVNYAEYENL